MKARLKVKSAMQRIAGMVAAVAISTGASSSAFAAITFDSSGGGIRSASATFDVVDGNLVVTLSNTGTEPTGSWKDTSLLEALFFNYTGPGTLNSAGNPSIGGSSQPGGSGTIGSLASGATIGSYWAYGNQFKTTKTGGAAQGLTAAGFNGYGNPSTGNMGPSGQTIDGADGGLLGWNNTTGADSSVTGHEPLAYSTIVFTLPGSSLPTSLTASMFSNVSFQYGTTGGNADNLQGMVVAVPESNYGSAAAMLTLPLIGLGLLRKPRANRGWRFA